MNEKNNKRAIEKQALNEAKLRRNNYLKNEKKQEKEIGGRKGLEPTRYGDWEKKGIVSDF